MKPCDFQYTSAVPAFHSWTHACVCACRRHGGPCAHRSAPGEPGMLDMWLFLQRKGSGACYSPRRLGMDVVNNPMTFALSVWQETIPVPRPDLYHKLLSQSIFRTHLNGRCDMYFTKCFNVVTSDLHLAYFVSRGPRGDLCMFYGAPQIKFITTRKAFTRLCCA